MQISETLYQVEVEDVKTGMCILVGPQLIRPAAEKFCAAIGIQIAKGREKNWSDPHIVQAVNLN